LIPINARVREVSRLTGLDGYTIEPVSLADAKNYLKVPPTITADDGLIRDLISQARIELEKFASATFVQATFEMVLDYFPPGNGSIAPIIYSYLATGTPFANGNADWNRLGIQLPFPPLVSVDSITYRDLTGTNQSLDPSPSAGNVRIVTGTPGQMIPVLGRIFPITRPEIGGVTIGFTAGISTTGQETILAPVRGAIRYMIGSTYTKRTGGIELDGVAQNIMSAGAWGGSYA
jgi:hypothetical protein